MNDPFFGDWVPRNNNTMSQGAMDFVNGKSLNSNSANFKMGNKTHDELMEEFAEQKKALKEMEKNMTPEDRKLLAGAMGNSVADGSGSVADRFRSAMKNMNKR
tara:strand:+ start:175 stop:483 length:309 start_codon:yes stop_codon:yes gene_type:complete